MRHHNLHVTQRSSDARHDRLHHEGFTNRCGVNPQQGAVSTMLLGPLLPTLGRTPASGDTRSDLAGQPRRALHRAGNDGIEWGRHGSKVLGFNDKSQG